MAPFMKFLCLLFLLSIVSSVQIHARESLFFSKFIHSSNNNNAKETELQEKKVRQDDVPNVTPETYNGFGLHGHDLDNTITNGAQYTYSNLPKETPTEYNGENYEYKEHNTGYPYNNNNYYNNGYNNNNGYMTKQDRDSDSMLTGNNNNINNGYKSKQQGMSDTRFLENGRYYYDVNNDNYYQNKFQPGTERTEGFESSNSRGMDSRNQYNYEGYYGKNENAYEFNSMEGYKNPGEEYVP